MLYQFQRGFSGGPALEYFCIIHRGGRTGTPYWSLRGRPQQSRPKIFHAERNTCDSKNILWAFVFSFRTCANFGSLSWCPQRPHHHRSLYNYLSICVHFFHECPLNFFPFRSWYCWFDCTLFSEWCSLFGSSYFASIWQRGTVSSLRRALSTLPLARKRQHALL